MAFVLNSPAFADGRAIPVKHTGDGANVSPPLEWSGQPAGTRSYALLVEDPDAPSGTFRHWAVYNIAGDRTRLPEGVTGGAKTESLGHGVNDFGHPHYDGPSPPQGHGIHHYHFRLAALDVPALDLPPKAGATDVWDEAGRHTIAQAELVGTYARGQPAERQAPAADGPEGRPTKGDPIVRGGDAGGPNDGRNAVGPDLNRAPDRPPPNRLGDTAYDRPGRGPGDPPDADGDPTVAGPDGTGRR